MRSQMINDLKTVERIAGLSKFRRMLNDPFKYLYAILYRTLVYPRTKSEKIVESELFFGERMKIALPAATDIYLTGGKSHPSEIRLARFLMLNLPDGGHFLDIGAHYGYFSLIAARSVGTGGLVQCLEPSAESYRILSANVDKLDNVTAYRMAVSDTTDKVTFYEFANLHSEYNSSTVKQFETEEWFRNAPPKEIVVEATTIDTIVRSQQFRPDVIKIDVEGAEDKVIRGGSAYFQASSPKIVLEYLEPARDNTPHKAALKMLRGCGYNSHAINDDGTLSRVDDIDAYLKAKGLDSDNIVFLK